MTMNSRLSADDFTKTSGPWNLCNCNCEIYANDSNSAMTTFQWLFPKWGRMEKVSNILTPLFRSTHFVAHDRFLNSHIINILKTRPLISEWKFQNVNKSGNDLYQRIMSLVTGDWIGVCYRKILHNVSKCLWFKLQLLSNNSINFNDSWKCYSLWVMMFNFLFDILGLQILE